MTSSQPDHPKPTAQPTADKDHRRQGELCPLLILLGRVVRRLLSKFYERLQRGRSRDVQVYAFDSSPEGS